MESETESVGETEMSLESMRSASGRVNGRRRPFHEEEVTSRHTTVEEKPPLWICITCGKDHGSRLCPLLRDLYDHKKSNWASDRPTAAGRVEGRERLFHEEVTSGYRAVKELPPVWVCVTCGQKGHGSSQCPLTRNLYNHKNTHWPSDRAAAAADKADGWESLCAACKQEGHSSRDCPLCLDLYDKTKRRRSPDRLPAARKADFPVYPELQCPCGRGPCLVRMSRTTKNPDRYFYTCPAPSEKCSYFLWCDLIHPIKLENDLAESSYPICACGAGKCRLLTVENGANAGCKYFACTIKKGQGACNYFQWLDSPVNQTGKGICPGKDKNSTPETPMSLEADKGTSADGWVYPELLFGRGSCVLLRSPVRKNSGRYLYACPMPMENCGFFYWPEGADCNQRLGFGSLIKLNRQQGLYCPVKHQCGAKSPTKPYQQNGVTESSFSICTCGAGKCGFLAMKNWVCEGCNYVGSTINKLVEWPLKVLTWCCLDRSNESISATSQCLIDGTHHYKVPGAYHYFQWLDSPVEIFGKDINMGENNTSTSGKPETREMENRTGYRRLWGNSPPGYFLFNEPKGAKVDGGEATLIYKPEPILMSRIAEAPPVSRKGIDESGDVGLCPPLNGLNLHVGNPAAPRTGSGEEGHCLKESLPQMRGFAT